MIRLDDVHAIKLIAMAAQIEFVPRKHHCIANYNDNDILMGGVLFTDYRGGSIAIHMAGFRPNWVSKAMIFLAFNYPFIQLNLPKLFATVPEWNVKSRNNTLHLGFKIEYLVPDVYARPDGVNGLYIMSMMRQDCRWLKMKVPWIEYAPKERTNWIDYPLASMPAVGVVQ